MDKEQCNVKKYLSLAAIPILYCMCLKPNNKLGRMDAFKDYYFAHRGFYDNKKKCPENSIPAFKKAIELGFGIELDVQKTSDGKLVVFHDASLDRICGKDKLLTECAYKELCSYNLTDTKEKIPTLDMVLKTVNGKVPLIIEIKPEGDWKRTTKLLSEKMKKYNGKYCIESFHPLAVALYKKLQPQIPRGQLASDMFKEKDKNNIVIKFLFTNLMLNFLAKPDFIAYNHYYSNNLSYRIIRKLFSVTNVAWTIKSKEELKKASKIFDIFIFEGFIPEK